MGRRKFRIGGLPLIGLSANAEQTLSQTLTAGFELHNSQWIIQDKNVDSIANCKISDQPSTSKQRLVITLYY